MKWKKKKFLDLADRGLARVAERDRKEEFTLQTKKVDTVERMASERVREAIARAKAASIKKAAIARAKEASTEKAASARAKEVSAKKVAIVKARVASIERADFAKKAVIAKARVDSAEKADFVRAKAVSAETESRAAREDSRTIIVLKTTTVSIA